MPRATCRCGQKLSLPVNGPDRVICPKCSARVRIRRDPPKVGPGDGFVRFNCVCGRRLKVRADLATGTTPQAGKCPDCGRVVPVPATASLSDASFKVKSYGSETPTEEMSPDEFAALARWAESHLLKTAPPAAIVQQTASPFPAPAGPAAPAPTPPPTPTPAPVSVKIEAGLRVCPRCGRPIHLSAVACRECGAPVPKR
jgi:hypothetical protein